MGLGRTVSIGDWPRRCRYIRENLRRLLLSAGAVSLITAVAAAIIAEAGGRWRYAAFRVVALAASAVTEGAVLAGRLGYVLGGGAAAGAKEPEEDVGLDEPSSPQKCLRWPR